MLTVGTDFKCELRNKVYICAANNEQTLLTFKALQNKVRAVAAAMAQVRSDVPGDLTTIEPDGRIGPTTALGVQTIIAVLNRSNPMSLELFPLLSLQATGQATIERVAAKADEILAYIDQTLRAYPDALKGQVSIMRIPFLKITRDHLIAGAGIAALMVGLGAVYVLREKRSDHEEGGRFPSDDDDDDEGSDEEAPAS